MAKLTNPLFSVTDKPEPTQQEKPHKRTPVSVYLSDEQRTKIDEIVSYTGMNRHAVIQYAIRQLIRDWDNGIKPEIITTTRLK